MAAYNVIAYPLWLILGLLGAHHFYLGRDYQGILYLTSFGGLFGLGWLRDFASLPRYVREANEDPEYLNKITYEMKHRKRPSIWTNLTRVIAQVMFGCFYRGLVIWSLPEEYSSNGYILLVLAPFGTAFGTYMISNIGVVRSKWWYSLLGAYVGEVLFGHYHFLLEASFPSLAASMSMLCSTFSWQYDRRPRGIKAVVMESASSGGGRRVKCCRGRGGVCCRRLAIWTLAFFVFSGFLISAVYFNASITTEEGETVKVRDAISNFFKSPYWKQLKKSFWADFWGLWGEYRENGWESAFHRLMVLADFQGEERSRIILGVPSNATLHQVKARYHQLAKEWHPDRFASANTEQREEAQEKFMEIKESYETLQKIYKKRKARSQRYQR